MSTDQKKQTKFLFIGGPIDGKRMDLPAPKRIIKIPVKDIDESYELTPFGEGENVVKLYKHDSLTTFEAFVLLLAKYPQPENQTRDQQTQKLELHYLSP